MQSNAGCLVGCQMYIMVLVLGQIIGIIKMLEFLRLRYLVLDCNLLRSSRTETSNPPHLLAPRPLPPPPQLYYYVQCYYPVIPLAVKQQLFPLYNASLSLNPGSTFMLLLPRPKPLNPHICKLSLAAYE